MAKVTFDFSVMAQSPAESRIPEGAGAGLVISATDGNLHEKLERELPATRGVGTEETE